MGSAIELKAFIAGPLRVSLRKAFTKEGIAFLSPILPRASAAGYAVQISSLSSIAISASTTEDSLTLPILQGFLVPQFHQNCLNILESCIFIISVHENQ